jgi:hypothetical protein
VKEGVACFDETGNPDQAAADLLRDIIDFGSKRSAPFEVSAWRADCVTRSIPSSPGTRVEPKATRSRVESGDVADHGDRSMPYRRRTIADCSKLCRILR